MYREISHDIYEVENIVRTILENEGINVRENDIIACYGSMATNSMNNSSDIDLLYIHNQDNSPKRIASIYMARSVTIYSLSLNDFLADGFNKFGGFFCVKLFNPCVIFPQNDSVKNIIRQAIGNFFGTYAAKISQEKNRKTLSREDLLKDVILSYLKICPAYGAYFLRYYTSKDFEIIWEIMEEEIEQAFLLTNVIEKIGEYAYEYINFASDQEVQEKMVLSIARFWAFGVSSHYGDYKFIDSYFEKSQNYIVKNGLSNQYEEMINFFNN